MFFLIIFYNFIIFFMKCCFWSIFYYIWLMLLNWTPGPIKATVWSNQGAKGPIKETHHISYFRKLLGYCWYSSYQLVIEVSLIKDLYNSLFISFLAIIIFGKLMFKVRGSNDSNLTLIGCQIMLLKKG